MVRALPGLEGLEAHAEARGLTRPRGAGAVMADRARGEVAGDDARAALWRKLEYFPTPPWAARAGAEMIAALDPQARWAWEPACGEGHMAHGLSAAFERVYATDIHDHGSRWQHQVLDFLGHEAEGVDQADWVITNPPFGQAAAFVAAGLRRAGRGVAMLCRSGWQDTAGRYELFYGAGGCDLELAFFERVPMCLGRWEPRSTEPGGSTATAYSWFIWFQREAKPKWVKQAQAVMQANLPLRLAGASVPIGGMGSRGLLTLGIPPGTKARLSRPEDVRLFCAPGAAPLFEERADG